MSDFLNWLENRINEYEVARQRGLKAYKTRWLRALTDANDGVAPTVSSAGYHAPYDGYIHTWVEGDHDYENTYLAGQFLPESKEQETVSCGWFNCQTNFTVPTERADKFMQDWVQLPESARSLITVHQSRSFDARGKLYCYITISKCPQDICDVIEDRLVGDLIKLQKLAEEQRNAELAKHDAEHEAGENAPEGRVTITGTVLALKWKESQYGSTLKMLVQDDRGFRVWGSVPANLDDAERESRITFTATVQASDRDEKFGFFKRPTKAEIITEAEAA